MFSLINIIKTLNFSAHKQPH